MKDYFTRFSLAEVQKTFYKPPRPETAQRWRQLAPEVFEFTLKAWQLITHPATSPTYRKAGIRVERPENHGFFRPTAEVYEAWDATLRVAAALEARVVVFQCPASFAPTEENLANMEEFFNSIPRKGLLLAWEPRGRWDRAVVGMLCQELELLHCVDPFLGLPAAAGETAYLRLHGYERGRMYYHDYTEEELRRLYQVCKNLGGSVVYCLFNNIQMLKNALEFRELISSRPTSGQL